jgi:heat shock protein HslJ
MIHLAKVTDLSQRRPERKNRTKKPRNHVAFFVIKFTVLKIFDKMKKETLLVVCSIITGLYLTCCTNSNQPAEENQVQEETMTKDMAHNSENSLDWAGTYRGTIPCEDCDGIETTISLSREKTYTRSMIFIGKSTEPISETGSFSFTEDGNAVVLEAAEGSRMYKLGENALIHLDNDGNVITGELSEAYRLEKSSVADSLFEGKRWNLIELKGKPIVVEENGKIAFMEFHTHESRIVGNTGCNNFFGQYQLLDMNRIRFGKIGATLMACPDLTTEESLLIALEDADNYSISDGVLSLNKAKMAPLARFKVDMQ